MLSACLGQPWSAALPPSSQRPRCSAAYSRIQCCVLMRAKGLQSTQNNCHKATTRTGHAGSARAHGPCFILPNGAWEICAFRLVSASGRNTNQTPTSTLEYRPQHCDNNALVPVSGPVYDLSQPTAFHSCVAVPSQTRQRLLSS
jgi:hypothetical protein